MKNNFVHLNLHTEYSLIDGVSKIDAYLSRAKQLGMTSLAITDQGNLFGAVEFYQKANTYGIKPIIGLEIFVSEFSVSERDKKNFSLILLAKNIDGYKNLMKISSEAYLTGFYKIPRTDKSFLKNHSDGLIALSSGFNGEIAHKILSGENEVDIENSLNEYIDIFGKDNFYIEIQATNNKNQTLLNDRLYDLSLKFNLELVATNDVHYVYEGEDSLQDVVICIQTGSKISDTKRLKAEATDLFLKTKEQMIESLSHKYLVAIENSPKIAEKCFLELPFGVFQFPDYEIPENMSSLEEYLKFLTYEGLRKIYPYDLNEEIVERIEYELNVITNMGYAGYFIVVWDFIYFSRRNNIPIGPGRGSVAGSLVAYALGITKVDPLKYGLIFERFLNPERISMPDIDIDICQDRRQEVIDYVFDKYGKDNVAQIITFGTMKARVAIRDVGRVFNVDLDKIDKAAKLIPFNTNIATALRTISEFKALYLEDSELQKVIDLASKLENKVRHSSIHAAGLVITKKPLIETVPIYLDSKNNVISTQFQMKELEELGLLKMDFLGLRNLTIIQKTIESIEKNRNIEIDLYGLPLDDKNVYDTLSKGDTSGVFQLESLGIRKILVKLRPDKFEDIIALLSLYRPGPLSSGMVDNFINAKNGMEEIIYPHPSLEPVLKETYGVILYQEQVMKIANIMATYSLGEADLLRRAMSKKNIQIMDENREKFIERSFKNGYSKEISEDVFNLINMFAGYGFNKSHSAAYALISYWTAYFKANYAKEYYASLMTYNTSDLDDIAFYFEDAREHNIKINPPNVNNPASTFSANDEGITFALSAIKNVGLSISEKIVLEYSLNGEYKDFEDFVLRNKKNGINKKAIEGLIFSGALDSLHGNRNQKFESLEKIIEFSNRKSKEDEIQQMNLFGEAKSSLGVFTLPEVEELELSRLLDKEKEFLGFYLSAHPLDKYKDIIQVFGISNIKEIINAKEIEKVKTFGIVLDIKKTTTKKGEMMCFFRLEDYYNSISTVVFPKLYSTNSNYVLDKKPVFIEGHVKTEVFKGKESKKLNVQNIISLDEVYLTKKISVYILIDEKNTEKYSRLKTIIKNYEGKTPLNFVITDEDNKVMKKTNLKVDVTTSFIKEVGELLGYNKIKVKI